MKDEEMAEQYAQNLEKELMKEYEEHSEYGQTAYLATIPTLHAKQAFLAGLKAGRLQWHDLRKDKNDLPKEDCEVFAYYEKGSLCGKAKLQKYKKGVLWVDRGEISLWVDDLGYQIRNVIAWCEIPTFDKE